MKKLFSIIIITAFLLISFKDSYAQGNRFGIKGGATAYNITTEVGGSEFTSDRKIGFEAGIFGSFSISEIIAIQPEAVFVQKGGEASNGQFGSSSATLSYVDVPVLLKVTAPLDGAVKPYVVAGPYAGYLIEATSDEEGESENVTEFVEDINYGLKLGLGVNIGSIAIDARYDMGLANLFADDGELSEIDDFKVTTSGVVVTLGITF